MSRRNRSKRQSEPANKPVPAAPKSQARDPKSGQLIFEQTEYSGSIFVGPVPHPDAVAKYEAILPGAADRIFVMAEKQQGHRMSLESRVVDADIRRSWWGLILGFVLALSITGAGAYLLAIGRNLEGFALVIGAVGGLLGMYIYGVKSKRDERRERSKNLTGPDSNIT